jgi:hypothetical protein
VPSPHADSLVGDLEEQFARGRSPLWYWRQVISAMLAGVANDVREHKLLAARSVIIAWAVMIPWVETTWALYLWVSARWVYAWVNKSPLLFTAWVLYGGGLDLVWCLGAGVSGWINVRLHRDHAGAIVFVSLISQLPLAVWWGWPMWLVSTWQVVPRFSVAIRVCAAVVIFGMPICTLLGGLWGARRDGTDRHQSPV